MVYWLLSSSLKMASNEERVSGDVKFFLWTEKIGAWMFYTIQI
jgi:hypothetical protein